VGGAASLQTPPAPNAKLEKQFCRHNDINALLEPPFSQNQPLKLADEWCIGLLNNRRKEHRENVYTFFFRLLLIFSVT